MSQPSTPPVDDFAARLLAGDSEQLDWIASRCEKVAGAQFSPWAWAWIKEDFVGDLMAQLCTAVQQPGFEIRSTPGAYVDTCIRNLCRRYFFEVARLRAGLPLAPSGLETRLRGDDGFAKIAATLDVLRALESLSPACRHLIESKYLLGATLAEIGAEIGVPEKTARSRLHTCREKLRELLRRGST